MSKNNLLADVKRCLKSHYAVSHSSSLYCLLFVELLVAEGLDNCRLLGKIRFHVVIPLPFLHLFPECPSVASFLLWNLFYVTQYPFIHPPDHFALSGCLSHSVLFNLERTRQYKCWFLSPIWPWQLIFSCGETALVCKNTEHITTDSGKCCFYNFNLLPRSANMMISKVSHNSK